MADETFKKLKEIIVDKMDVDADDVTPDKSFEDLGVDSLDLYEMVYEIETVFGVTIPEKKTPDLNSVQDVIDYIEANK